MKINTKRASSFAQWTRRLSGKDNEVQMSSHGNLKKVDAANERSRSLNQFDTVEYREGGRKIIPNPHLGNEERDEAPMASATEVEPDGIPHVLTKDSIIERVNKLIEANACEIGEPMDESEDVGQSYYFLLSEENGRSLEERQVPDQAAIQKRGNSNYHVDGNAKAGDIASDIELIRMEDGIQEKIQSKTPHSLNNSNQVYRMTRSSNSLVAPTDRFTSESETRETATGLSNNTRQETSKRNSLPEEERKDRTSVNAEGAMQPELADNKFPASPPAGSEKDQPASSAATEEKNQNQDQESNEDSEDVFAGLEENENGLPPVTEEQGPVKRNSNHVKAYDEEEVLEEARHAAVSALGKAMKTRKGHEAAIVAQKDSTGKNGLVVATSQDNLGQQNTPCASSAVAMQNPPKSSLGMTKKMLPKQALKSDKSTSNIEMLNSQNVLRKTNKLVALPPLPGNSLKNKNRKEKKASGRARLRFRKKNALSGVGEIISSTARPRSSQPMPLAPLDPSVIQKVATFTSAQAEKESPPNNMEVSPGRSDISQAPAIDGDPPILPPNSNKNATPTRDNEAESDRGMSSMIWWSSAREQVEIIAAESDEFAAVWHEQEKAEEKELENEREKLQDMEQKQEQIEEQVKQEEAVESQSYVKTLGSESYDKVSEKRREIGLEEEGEKELEEEGERELEEERHERELEEERLERELEQERLERELEQERLERELEQERERELEEERRERELRKERRREKRERKRAMRSRRRSVLWRLVNSLQHFLQPCRHQYISYVE
jgi:hypothetical protein